MTSQLINGLIYDTDKATLVTRVPKMLYAGPGLLKDSDTHHCEIYISPNGNWFVADSDMSFKLARTARALLGRRDNRTRLYALTEEEALRVLHQINAYAAARKWFPDKVREA